MAKEGPFDIDALLAAHTECEYDLSYSWAVPPPLDAARVAALLAQPPSNDLVAFWPYDVALLTQAGHLDCAAARVEVILARPNWKLPHQQMNQVELGMSMTAQRLSEVYLLLGDALPELRTRIAEAIIVRGLEPFYVQATDPRRPGWAGTVMNWRGVICAEMGRAAFHLAAVYPHWREVVAEGIKGCIAMADAGGIDGGWEEGVGYWGYGFGQLAYLAEELYVASGGRVNLFAHPFLRVAGDLALYMTMPGGHDVYGFADWRVAQPRSDLLALLARHTGNPHYAWAAARSAYSPLGRGWRPDDLPAPQPPVSLPSCKHFRGIDAVVLRSGWGDDALVAALKCGPRRVTHHQHLDANSFILFAGATPLLDELRDGADGVKCTAADTARLYMSLGLRGTAVNADAALGERATVAHNTVIFGDQPHLQGRNAWGQPVPTWRHCPGDPTGLVRRDAGAHIVHAGRKGAQSVATGDATLAYPDIVGLFRRTLIMRGPDHLLVMDVLQAAGPLTATALFHVPGEIALRDDHVVLRCRDVDAKLRIRLETGKLAKRFLPLVVEWPLDAGEVRHVLALRYEIGPSPLRLAYEFCL